ncbi:hypothetical protein ABZW67_06210 [Streptomyces rubiginosohelvolus]|uniref:hypothetical protein n=1 Tax=Streptomyces rubiginosohelvolus TaxID=67362 RepID=UPI00339DEBF3
MADARELLEKMVVAYTQLDEEREEWLRINLEAYDPHAVQPCADSEMGEYDLKSAEWAFDAEKLLSGFVHEARGLLEGATQ